MNTDVSFIRGYIIQTPPSAHAQSLPSANSHGNAYQRLLPRRQEYCRSARKPSSTVTGIEQTLTLFEQLKLQQNRSITNFNYLPDPLPKYESSELRTLTPHELSSQLNAKLDHLIRTRVIDRSRVTSRTSLLPPTPVKPRPIPLLTPRDASSRTPLSAFSQSSQKNVLSSSASSTRSDATLVPDELPDKDSLGDNDETFEEMVEEENLNFLQPPP